MERWQIEAAEGVTLVQKKPTDGDERMVVCVGGALLIGNHLTGIRFQKAEHQIERSKATNSVAVPGRPDLPIIVGRVAAQGRLDQFSVVAAQAVATRLIHDERVAKCRSDVSQVDGSNGQYAKTLGGSPQDFEKVIKRGVVGRVCAIAQVMMERADEDWDHRAWVRTYLMKDVMEPNGR